MVLLGVLDFLFVNHACHSIITRGASVQLVFGFEVNINLILVLLCLSLRDPAKLNFINIIERPIDPKLSHMVAHNLMKLSNL